MCAIGGFLWRKAEDNPADPSKIRRMSEAMYHRGPDGEGFHHESRIDLLHRLLRIFDRKSLPGPYISRDGRWVLSFNGEIYNYQELRAELEKSLAGGMGRLRSDAEALLEGWALHGPGFLRRINGMFAFALWDRREKRLILCRDRLGEKPLYYFLEKDRFLFASEVKGLKAAGIPMRLNRPALHDYLAHRYVPGPETLFAGIRKLLPGHLLTVNEDFSVSLESYWSPPAPQVGANPNDERRLAELLESSHSLRLQSSWTPGVFLSGGVDSATVASFMPGRSSALTFLSPMTVAEGEAAKRISERFGLAHQEVRAEGSLGEIVDQAIWALEEPLGDSIIIPTWSLAKAASRSTRVVLSGEGADEIFGGYVHHFLFRQLEILRSCLGPHGLYAGAWLLEKIPARILERVTPYPAALGEEARRRLLQTIRSLAGGTLSIGGLTTLFPHAFSHSSRGARETKLARFQDLLRLDQQTWLPDYTLHRLDKILMSQGVEGRLPFLDHRIVELASSWEANRLIRRNHRKWPLRKAVAKRLGPDIAWKKKIPFLMNVADEPELRARGLSALDALRSRGLLPPDFDTAAMNSSVFLAGKRLFALDALETWIRAYEIEV